MEKEEIIKEIKYYHLYLTNCFTNYCITERLIDWYETDEFKNSKLFFSFTTNALKKQWLIEFVCLFTKREEKNIITLCNSIIFGSEKQNAWLTPQIKMEFKNLLDEINNNEDSIKKSQSWRDSVYAHADKFLFDTKKCQDFMNNNKIEVDKINNLIYFAYRTLDNCLVKLGATRTLFKYNNINDIDNVFLRTSNIKKPSFSVNYDLFE